MKIKSDIKWMILVFLLLFSLALPFRAYAYWSGGAASPPPCPVEGTITIGRWYYHDPADPDSPPVVHFDPTNPVKIPAGSLVVVQVDGNTYIFQALETVDPHDPNYDPMHPNTSWAKPMLYSADTKGYRSFHRYQRGDYVIYNGKTYQWVYGIAHNPNTLTQIAPGTNEKRWKTFSDTPEEGLWYRHKIYYEGDVVSYDPHNHVNAGRYRCRKSGLSGAGSNGIEPGNDAQIWEYLGPLE